MFPTILPNIPPFIFSALKNSFGFLNKVLNCLSKPALPLFPSRSIGPPPAIVTLAAPLITSTLSMPFFLPVKKPNAFFTPLNPNVKPKPPTANPPSNLPSIPPFERILSPSLLRASPMPLKPPITESLIIVAKLLKLLPSAFGRPLKNVLIPSPQSPVAKAFLNKSESGLIPSIKESKNAFAPNAKFSVNFAILSANELTLVNNSNCCFPNSLASFFSFATFAFLRAASCVAILA